MEADQLRASAGPRFATRRIFADRIILKHEPRAIVFYAGDNDVNAGRTPDQVAADFAAFAAAIRQGPAEDPRLFHQHQAQRGAMEAIRDAKQGQRPRQGVMREGRAARTTSTSSRRCSARTASRKQELFVKDGLHLSPKGYEILNEAVRKAVK